MSLASQSPAVRRLDALRCLITGALGLSAVFAMCWVGGVFVPEGAHRFVRIFTSSPPTSGLALMEGAGFAAIFGAIAGALTATFYNLLAVVEAKGGRRS